MRVQGGQRINRKKGTKPFRGYRKAGGKRWKKTCFRAEPTPRKENWKNKKKTPVERPALKDVS